MEHNAMVKKMNNALLIAVIALLLAVAATMVVLVDVSGCEKDDIHLIVFSQESETEFDVKVADGERHKETVDAGVTYMSYKADKPEVTVWNYGEKEKLRVDKGRDGDYYCIVFLKKPMESVGE